MLHTGSVPVQPNWWIICRARQQLQWRYSPLNLMHLHHQAFKVANHLSRSLESRSCPQKQTAFCGLEILQASCTALLCSRSSDTSRQHHAHLPDLVHELAVFNVVPHCRALSEVYIGYQVGLKYHSGPSYLSYMLPLPTFMTTLGGLSSGLRAMLPDLQVSPQPHRTVLSLRSLEHVSTMAKPSI